MPSATEVTGRRATGSCAISSTAASFHSRRVSPPIPRSKSWGPKRRWRHRRSKPMGLRERIEEEELRHAFDQNEKLVNALYDAREQISSPKSEVEDRAVEEVPDIGYDDIGGLGTQIEAIKDAVELPYLYADYYKEHQLTPPKGVLLYGPPGCGKTMIAKAVANNLAEKISEKRGEKIKGFFLNIKGPELLNKYVGETERKIREIFIKAKEKASEDVPVIVFFDEMDALFRTRGTGISSDVETTIVPQQIGRAHV